MRLPLETRSGLSSDNSCGMPSACGLAHFLASAEWRTAMDVALNHSQELADQATAYLIERYSPSGRRVGWMMIASIFIEAWDLYAISFLLVFLTDQYHPSALLLGLASAGTQAGAIVGSLVGGWLMDKVGRRVMFLGTMVMFVV